MTDWTHRLKLRHLEILLSLAQTGNLSQSAVALNSTQPALSKWLKELEEDIGLSLFERRVRGLRPTVHGQSLITHAQRILGHLDSARNDLAAQLDGGSGFIAIGTSGVSSSDTVPMAVARLIERLPRAEIQLVESTMSQMLSQLLSADLDIVVGRTADEPLAPALLCETLYREPLCFICGPGHPLARRKTVDWNDVLGFAWIIWPRDTQVYKALHDLLASMGRKVPRNCVESTSAITNIKLLRHTGLIGIASKRAALSLREMNALCVLPMQLPEVGSVSMYWRKDSVNRTVLALALDQLRLCARMGDGGAG